MTEIKFLTICVIRNLQEYNLSVHSSGPCFFFWFPHQPERNDVTILRNQLIIADVIFKAIMAFIFRLLWKAEINWAALMNIREVLFSHTREKSSFKSPSKLNQIVNSSVDDYQPSKIWFTFYLKIT